jgi:putative acyl-CoA dehydrogenase
MRREPASVDAFVGEVENARGIYPSLDEAIARLADRFSRTIEEAEARRLVEEMALVLQGAVLVQRAPPAIAEAFCATRLAERPGMIYGAPAAKIDDDAILSRTAPFL